MTMAIIAAMEAGKAILEVYETDFSVEYKEDKSPLTMADMISHKIIKKFLANDKDSFPLLSEEGRDIPYKERKNWEYFWIIDPLDGTKEFVKRNGEFTVNIALAKNIKPVAGVIFSPVHDNLYFGSEDSGAYLVEQAYSRFATSGTKEEFIKNIPVFAEKLPMKSRQEESETLYVVASRSHFSGDTENYVNSLKKKYRNIELISAGSSLKMCLVAEGRAQLYPRFAPTCEWDTAAGQAIVEAAGGKVIHYNSDNPLVYNKESLINPWFIAKARGY
ncbi:MAG: 3'(2'),5'-bisphosphate nucleotidase CysQ [Spirochaetales bacterium]|nr:3'(2'),5'-bisphosphate nucleotidase CysQ [Spirochaetales bacterium]